jgi:hypothetical protein
MKVIKVIVDKVPKDLFCFECGFCYRDVDGDDACAAIQNFDNDEIGKTKAGQLRPNWCPLEEEIVITSLSAKGVEVIQDDKVIFSGNIVFDENGVRIVESED